MGSRVGLRLAVAALVTYAGLGVSSPAAFSAEAAPPVAPVSWQSAGDSYSSGEGVLGNEGDCAQSREAYGPKAAAQLRVRGWEFSSETFTACTGHLVGDYFNKRPGTGSKVSLWEWGREQRGPPKVDIITMSFGGNDVGFGSVLKSCLGFPTSWGAFLGTGPAECDRPEELMARADQLLDPTQRGCTGSAERPSYDCDLNLGSRRGSIIDFYYDIVTQRLTANGQLYVVGYPQLFAPLDQWPLWNRIYCKGMPRGNAETIRTIARHLNTKLTEAVDRANQALGSDRVFFVDRLAVYANGDHDLCGRGQDWLNGISSTRAPLQDRLETSFHPNAAGHQAVADTLTNLVDEKFPRVAPEPAIDGAPPVDAGAVCRAVETRLAFEQDSQNWGNLIGALGGDPGSYPSFGGAVIDTPADDGPLVIYVSSASQESIQRYRVMPNGQVGDPEFVYGGGIEDEPSGTRPNLDNALDVRAGQGGIAVEFEGAVLCSFRFSPPIGAPAPATPPPSTSDLCGGDVPETVLATVMDVPPGDVLNVRAAPDPSAPMLGSVPGGATVAAHVATERQVGNGSWVIIEIPSARSPYSDSCGWVNRRYLDY